MSIDVYVSPEARAWLTQCHAQDEVVARVIGGFAMHFQMIRELGSAYGGVGPQPIKRLRGHDGLWEMRVRDPTGQYRLFFRFVDVAGRRAAAVWSGTMKHEDLPPDSIALAARRTLEYVDRLRTELAARTGDLTR